jgi:GNAT superfamily N-acetyltransferase
MGLKIKTAEESDVLLIETLLSVSFAEFKSVYTKEAFKATVIKKNEIFERMSEGPIWIAQIEGKIIGTLSAVLKGGSLYVRGMAVHPEARGRRVGEKLLEEAEKFASVHKINRLFLGTTQYLISAIRLYERKGFKTYGEKDFYGMRLRMMEKFLNL